MKSTCSFAVSIYQSGKTLAENVVGTAFDALFSAFAREKEATFSFAISSNEQVTGHFPLRLGQSVFALR
jgi:hypothetical protein